MLLAEHVGEAKIDELDFVFLDQLENVLGGHGRPQDVGAANAAMVVPTEKVLKCSVESMH
jgi:hypothetical protein